MSFKQMTVATVLAGLIVAPAFASSPVPYCIAVGGGFGNGGTTFVARSFTVPDASKCSPWAGYTKTEATVIATTNGTACMSSDGTVLTVSVTSADPAFFSPGVTVSDYIQVCPAGDSSCPIGAGQDIGNFTGSAELQDCTDNLLFLPTIHD
jgi:hypothetical protein